MTERISWAKAKQAVCKRLPLRPERTIAKNIEDWGLTAAEAFVVGAEEAQAEMIKRINALRPVPETASEHKP